jgi:hypothetical protein
MTAQRDFCLGNSLLRCDPLVFSLSKEVKLPQVVRVMFLPLKIAQSQNTRFWNVYPGISTGKLGPTRKEHF